MELILISDSKLKVMLSAEDMRRYELNCDAVDSGDPTARRAFWDILDEARRRTGFDAAGSRVFVQLYPSREGGCEMFVTKLGARAQAAEKAAASDAVLYGFFGMDDLLAACRRLMTERELPPVRTLTDGEGRLYLETARTLDWMPEYNALRCPRERSAFLGEYGRCFCADAAARLGPLG